MERRRYILFWLVCCAILSSCKKDDDYVYPPVFTDILCVETDSKGKIAHLLTDKGVSYEADNGESYGNLVADTIYRMQCIYEPLQGSGASSALIYSLRLLGSWIPIQESDLKADIKTDPVEIESIWMSGEYINIAALVKLQDRSKHTFHFIETGIAEEPGMRTLNLTLFHDRGEDVEGYTQRIYFSVPLFTYKEVLSQGSCVAFSINTYKSGMKTYSFSYPAI